jgi:hypothetical protein
MLRGRRRPARCAVLRSTTNTSGIIAESLDEIGANASSIADIRARRHTSRAIIVRPRGLRGARGR